MPAFRHLPVHSFEDVTHDLEQLESERMTELQGIRRGKSFNPGSPAALVARTAGTEYEPSPAKDTLVMLTFVTKGAKELNAFVLVAGVHITSVGIVGVTIAGNLILSATVLVPLGTKWVVKVEAGEVNELYSSYTFLD